MAIYHFTAKVIGRSRGRSAVAAAAYRSGSKLHDARQDLNFDYTHKSEVVFSEILLPEGAPAWMGDRETLWNAVEAGERRKDAQLARDIEFALPQELGRDQAIALARDFVRSEFVARGMVADMNVHWEPENPHVHVMLTMREVNADGFGRKVTEWNQVALLREWRERWADLANEHLLRAGHDVRIDHRSYKEQGVELEPTSHLGRAVEEMVARGEYAERARQLEEVRERNAGRIERRPEIVLENLTRQRSTFTRTDMARELFRNIDDGERFRKVMGRLEGSRELVMLTPELIRDGETIQPARYTTRTMLAIEARMAATAQEMAARVSHPVSERSLSATLGRHGYLSEEQKEAVAAMTSPRQIEAVAGAAGAGKSKAIEAAREAWEAQGYRVTGAALSGIAAENLSRESGVESRTLASWEHSWKQGRDRLDRRSVLVIDEAGMVGSIQLDRMLSEAKRQGAKVVLVGDSEQLQPIEAGAAFRAITERVGYRELTAIRRQHEQWQRDASRDFARGEPGRALDRYDAHGAIQFEESKGEAKHRLIQEWAKHRAAEPDGSTLILAHTRADVRDLNNRARQVLQERGELRNEVSVSVSRETSRSDGTSVIERSERILAPGDRVMFLKNNRELGVKNGSLATVTSVTKDAVAVRLDGTERREIEFRLADYSALDYGYAATIHKAQGATVERAFVLATPGMDRHLAYVAMTRHREQAEIYAGREDFKDFDALKQRLSRERMKDTTLDYAERRGLETGERGNASVSECDPITRFREAQQEFIRVGGRADLDPAAKARAAKLRAEMSDAAVEISRSASRFQEAERAGIGSQVRDFIRRAEREHGVSAERGIEKEGGLER
ncbi:MAG: Ti-type conjugative transfer relaxase TraA [Candidatus Binataceae bacterium]